MICYLGPFLNSRLTLSLDYFNHLLAVAVIKKPGMLLTQAFALVFTLSTYFLHYPHGLLPFLLQIFAHMPPFLNIFANYPLHPSFLAIALTTVRYILFYLFVCLSIFKSPYIISMGAENLIYFILCSFPIPNT